jgi:tetratricopeptide (TPR) repeat protein
MFSFTNILRNTCRTRDLASTYLYNKHRSYSASANAEMINVTSSLRVQAVPLYRPTDLTHIHYAVEVYKDTGGNVLETDGWELLTTYTESNGYFGAAYKNDKNKHIIISHRGTQDLRDWQTNLDLMTRRLNSQEASAWYVFSRQIIKDNGPNYSYSFTGHSLGGWLAQICLWNYHDEFVKDQYSLYKDSFAITLEEPGAKEILEELQPRIEVGYRIDVNKLDITSYLSYPNIANTVLGHVGSVYALFPNVQDLSWLQYHTIGYTLKTHSKDLLINEFNQKTGLPNNCVRVIDWPKITFGNPSPSSNNTKSILGYIGQALKAYIIGDVQRGEYTGFYNFTSSEINNPESLPPASQFQLKHGIHYQVKNFSEKILPLRNMPSAIRNFLEDLNNYKDRIKIIKQLIPECINLDNDNDFAKNIENFYINQREELVLYTNSIQFFREELLKFLNVYPALMQTKLAVQCSEHNLRVQENNNLDKLLIDLHEQTKHTADLLYKLSFQQGIAHLYKFVKPTWEELENINQENYNLKKQLSLLQTLKLRLNLNAKNSTIFNVVYEQEQQLSIAQKSIAILKNYMQSNLEEANEDLNNFISKLSDLNIQLDKKLLLNNAYNLKAKIAARQGKMQEAIEHYGAAISLLPHDSLTWNNYGSALIDFGHMNKDANYYLQAYNCFQKVDLRQIKITQLPAVYSSKAYSFILLASSIERKQMNQPLVTIPSVTELRREARRLLSECINMAPLYLNARLHSAILSSDLKNYSRALQEINNTLNIQRNHAPALMYKGYILAELNQVEEALVLLTQAKHMFEEKYENLGWLRETNEYISNIQDAKNANIKNRWNNE